MVIKFIIFTVAVSVLVACDKPSPEQWRQKQHLPPEGFVGNAQKGGQLFHSMCAQCHGAAAKGSDRGPPLVHKVYNSKHHADIAFHWAVRDGVKQHHWKFGNMPPIAMSPEDTGHIIAYIRQKQREAGIK
ncbi:MAG: cytochrome c [Gammaproteobacteria bacterium]|nr:cytochrome c [Gammaproteobacteria bacterium]MDH5800383.1 cytochrome c [Gammaproteobacteria bacterium]